VKANKLKHIAWVIGLIMVLGGASAGADPSFESPLSPPEDVTEPDSPDEPEGETEEEKEEPPVNRLKWSTATEVDNLGFDLFRSTSEDGEFVKINKELIPGAGTVDEPTYYVYVDEEIDPTQDYYYYIESISIDGVREQFSPIMKAPAKQPKK
jgi:hypothetical protein